MHERPVARRTRVGATAPVESSARLRALDALRGVALLGILLANVRQMLLPWDAAEFDVPLGEPERVAWIDWQIFHALVDFKFITLFSVMFGLGFALQSDRTQDRGSFFRLYLRRVGILGGLGLLHAWLLYPAEVLMPYAVGGFLLLFAHTWSGDTLIRTGVLLLSAATIWQYQVSSIRPIFPGTLVVGITLLAVAVTVLWRRSVRVALIACVVIICGAGAVVTSRVVSIGVNPAAREYQHARLQAAAITSSDSTEWPEELRVRRTGDFDALVDLHARQSADILLGFAVVLLWRTLGLFMIGAGVFRLAIVTKWQPIAWRRLAVTGLGIGVPLSLLATWLYGLELRGVADYRFPELLHVLSALPLAAGIAGSVFALHPILEDSRLWRTIEAAGRMPLSNYVGQSFLMALIAEPWGLGWYGRLGTPTLTILAFPVFAVAAVASHMWLTHFRMGPLEWMWRCGTYWRLLPNRLS